MCCKAVYVHIEIVLTYMRVFTYICIIMYLHSISRQLVSTHSAQFTLTKRPFKRSGFKAEPPKPAKPSSEVKAAPKTATCLDRSQRVLNLVIWKSPLNWPLNHMPPAYTYLSPSLSLSRSLSLSLFCSRSFALSISSKLSWSFLFFFLTLASCCLLLVLVISGVNIGQQEDGDNRIQRLNSTCSSWHLY